MHNFNLLFIFIIFFFLGGKISANDITGNSNSTARVSSDKLVPVEIYFDPQAEAKKYEFEIYSSKKKLIKKVLSPTPGFKFKMQCGNYLLRSRAADSRNLWSDWSEFSDFQVIPPTPKLTELPKVIAKKEKGQINGLIELSWEKSTISEQYDIFVKNENNEVVKKLVSITESHSVLTLPPGKYHVEIISKVGDNWRSEPMKMDTPIEISNVAAKEPDIKVNPEDPKKINFTNDSDSVVNLVVEYSPLMVENWKQIESGFTKSDSELKFDSNAKPGKYRYTLWTTKPGWIDSEKIQNEFLIKPQESDLIL